MGLRTDKKKNPHFDNKEVEKFKPQHLTAAVEMIKTDHVISWLITGFHSVRDL